MSTEIADRTYPKEFHIGMISKELQSIAKAESFQAKQLACITLLTGWGLAAAEVKPPENFAQGVIALGLLGGLPIEAIKDYGELIEFSKKLSETE